MNRDRLTWTLCGVISAFTIACVTETENNPMDTETTADTADGGDTETIDDTQSEASTESDSQPIEDDLEIIGTYTTDFGSSVTVSNVEWKDETTFGDVTYTSLFTITYYDNRETYLVAQNNTDNSYNPELWSRFDWTVSVDTIYYCQSVYDAASEAVAKAAGDVSDPDNLDGGCGGFPWSQLIPD